MHGTWASFFFPSFPTSAEELTWPKTKGGFEVSIGVSKMDGHLGGTGRVGLGERGEQKYGYPTDWNGRFFSGWRWWKRTGFGISFFPACLPGFSTGDILFLRFSSFFFS